MTNTCSEFLGEIAWRLCASSIQSTTGVCSTAIADQELMICKSNDNLPAGARWPSVIVELRWGHGVLFAFICFLF